MSQRTIKRRGMRNSRGKNLPVNPDPGIIHYTGPINYPILDTSVVTLYDSQAMDSDASGNLSAFVNNNPSSARNFTEYSGSWYEYRVLAVKISYFPKAVNNTATLPGFDGYSGLVHGLSISAPSTLAQAASTGLSKPWIAFRPFTRSWRMETATEAPFIPTLTPATTSNCFALTFFGGGATLHYGNLEIQYLVQYKTHSL
jgi:hypothetical protein